MLTSTFAHFIDKYVILRLIFGYSIDFGTSKYILVLCSCYCFTFLLTYISTYVLVFVQNTELRNIDNYNAIEVVVNCTAALIFKSKYVKKYIALLSKSGDLLQTKTISVPWKIMLYLFFTFCLRIYNFSIQTKFTFPSVSYFIALTLIISFFVNYNSKLFVLNVIHHQIRCLRRKFDTKFMMLNIIGKERRDYKISNMKTCLVVYDMLITSVEEMDYEIETWVNALFHIVY